MTSDPFHPDHRPDPLQSGASIPEVTRKTLRAAARKAAQVADAVAHHAAEAGGSDARPHAAATDATAGGPPQGERVDEQAGAVPTDQAVANKAVANEAAASGSISSGEVPSEGVSGEAVASQGLSGASAASGSVASEAPRAAAEPPAAAQSAAVPAAEPVPAAADLGPAAPPPATRAAGSGAADVLAQYNDKLLTIIGANIEASGALFRALLRARSLPEAAAVNADHLRRQMDALTSQGRDLATLAQKLAFSAMEPIRDDIATRFRDPR